MDSVSSAEWQSRQHILQKAFEKTKPIVVFLALIRGIDDKGGFGYPAGL